MSTNSFKSRLVSLAAGGVPLVCGPSFVRLAASAYRSDPSIIPRAEIDRRQMLVGEVTYLRSGEDFLTYDLSNFERFRADMMAELAKAFGMRKP